MIHGSKFIRFLFLIAASGVLPVAAVFVASDNINGALIALIALHLTGWSLLATALFATRDLGRHLKGLAQNSGIEIRDKDFTQLFYAITNELSRKNKALSHEIVENRISSREELLAALERIVKEAFSLLGAESAEVALYDPSSGGYHSSFVLGRPFLPNTSGLIAEFNSNPKGVSLPPEVLIQPICFAGSVLGGLAVALKRGKIPTISDREILRILALQGSLAIINSTYHEELLRLRRHSEESIKAKTGFLANLSHEIRSPLGIMLNAVELVLEGLCGPVTADQTETLGMVRQNGKHLLDLITDVLDYAKLEAGRITTQPQEIILQEILTDVTNVIRTQAQQKEHTLRCRESQETLAIMCDQRHLRQMLINVLSNAIKYTPKGGRIEVWAERVSGNRIRINVKDNGIGIETSQRHKVFGAFERIENSYTLKQVGTGLGMPLTKRLAEVNGGSVDFESVEGEGSNFFLTFPTHVVQGLTRLGDSAPTGSQIANGERVLIADRNDGERPMVARYLEHLGFAVTQASDTKQALSELKSADFQLMVVGNELVDDSNEKFLQEVRAVPNLGSIPIVLVSSRAFDFDTATYLKQGVDLCLSKPIELRALGQTLQEMLVSKARLTDLPPAKEATPNLPRVSKVIKSGDFYH
jgi:signal transduction histidine kinase/ActR/RegA family two-component response regulator